ncbi:MAG: sigma-E processing peptidase SpoIIGA [Lachnospiraceae bacterium]
MQVILYLDTVFLLNLSMNLWVISLAIYKLKISVTHRRRWGVALLGAFFYCLVFYIPFYGGFHMILAILLSNISMIFFLLPKRYKRYRWKVLGLTYFYTFLFWGIFHLVETKLQKPEHILYIIPFLFTMYILFYIIRFTVFCWNNQKREKVFDILIKSNGVEYLAKGLYDSGNTLIEPISKKPVCLVEEELLAKITLENPLFLRAIPYHSIGKEFGMLYGVEIPCMHIYTPEREIVKHNVVCAGVNQKISGFDKVQMILHSSICECSD